MGGVSGKDKNRMAFSGYGYDYDLLLRLMTWRFGDPILPNR